MHADPTQVFHDSSTRKMRQRGHFDHAAVSFVIRKGWKFHRVPLVVIASSGRKLLLLLLLQLLQLELELLLLLVFVRIMCIG